jgi:hypothetical protein
MSKPRLTTAAGVSGTAYRCMDRVGSEPWGGRTLRYPDGTSEPLDAAIGRVTNGAIEAYAENTPHGVPPDGLKKLYQGHAVLAGGDKLWPAVPPRPPLPTQGRMVTTIISPNSAGAPSFAPCCRPPS